MAVTWTQVRDLPGGAFSSYTQTEIEAAMARAGRRINSAYWDTLEDDGVLYLTAHLIATEDTTNAAAGGSLKKVKAGPLEKEYQNIMWSAKWYNTTPYGREYHELRETLRHKATGRTI